jgi:hypothetical protein
MGFVPNTFHGPALSVWLRGVPTEGAEVHAKWFGSPGRDAIRTGARSRGFDNAYGLTAPMRLDALPGKEANSGRGFPIPA